jgi:hypothetical protein
LIVPLPIETSALLSSITALSHVYRASLYPPLCV